MNNENNNFGNQITNNNQSMNIPNQTTMNQEQNNYNQNNFNSQPVNGYQSLKENNDKDKKSEKKLIRILIITNIITAILLIIVTVLLILKCDTNNSVKTNEKTEEKKSYKSTATTKPVSNDWKQYQFSINGKTLSLPCTYLELKDVSGFSMKSADEKSFLERNSSISLNLYIGNAEKKKLALYIDLKNNTKEDMAYIDAEVGRISQTLYQVETNNANIITFPGNLKVGMEKTKEEIIELYGEPSSQHEYINENYKNITLKYIEENEEYSTVNYYEIVLTNDKIDQLTLDHKKY